MVSNRYEIDGRVEVSAPMIAFSRSSLDFGLLGIGELETRTLRISNVGTAPLAVAAAGGPALGPFSWNGLQTTLSPNDGIDLAVEFSPLAGGKAHGAITVTSNAQGSPHSIPLSGSGRNEIPN